MDIAACHVVRKQLTALFPRKANFATGKPFSKDY